MPEVDQELVALEREGWAAFSVGVMARDEAIAAISSAPPWSAFELHDARVVELTPNSGVVVYRAEAQRAGQEPDHAATRA